jgi:hypothetical protein
MPFPRLCIKPLLPLLMVGLISSCGLLDDDFQEHPPPGIATSGDDLVVEEQTRVTLTSSIINDFDNVTSIRWEQTSGPPVALQEADTASVRFMAPIVLAQNSPAVMQFTVTLDAVTRESTTSPVRVFVVAANETPVARDDSVTLDEGATATFTLLNNDADGDGGIALDGIEIVSNPTNGTVALNPDGTVTYTHDGSETLADAFTYRVRDNEFTLSNEATCEITLNPVNDPPVANPATLFTEEEQEISLTLSATDPDSDVTFSLASDAENGSVRLTNPETGAFTYTPDPNANGGSLVICADRNSL